MNKKKKLYIWSLVIALLVLIFMLSSQPAVDSNGLSKAMTEILDQWISKIVPQTGIRLDNHTVRKGAHFFLFFCLGILSALALKASGIKKYGVFALLICMVYAISDEGHQYFVGTRGPAFKDVMIDSFGALCGLGVFFIMTKIRGLFHKA